MGLVRVFWTDYGFLLVISHLLVHGEVLGSWLLVYTKLIIHKSFKAKGSFLRLKGFLLVDRSL